MLGFMDKEIDLESIHLLTATQLRVRHANPSGTQTLSLQEVVAGPRGAGELGHHVWGPIKGHKGMCTQGREDLVEPLLILDLGTKETSPDFLRRLNPRCALKIARLECGGHTTSTSCTATRVKVLRSLNCMLSWRLPKQFQWCPSPTIHIG